MGDIRTPAETDSTSEKTSYQEYIDKYNKNQMERKAKERFNRPALFGNLELALFKMGLFGEIGEKSALNDHTSKPDILKKILRDADINTFSEEEEPEKIQRFRKLVDVIKNAEYLTSELPSLEISITPGRKAEDFISTAELPYGYSSPPILELKFKTSEMYYQAALKAGFSPRELENIFPKDEEGNIELPKQLQEITRSKQSITAWSFPLVDLKQEEIDFYIQHPNNLGAYVNQQEKNLQEKITGVEHLNVVIHGWTGSEKIARSEEPEIETDLAEAYFAHLSPEEQKHGAVLSMRQLGPFTEEVNMENGYGPSDYAHEMAFALSAIGITHTAKDSPNTKEKTITLTGHSMGGASVEHLATSYRKEILKNKNVKWVFAMMNPARIGKNGDTLHNTHYWSDASLYDDAESQTDMLLRRASAIMIEKGSSKIKNIIVNKPGSISTRLKKTLGNIYKYPEAIVAGLLASQQLLKGEKCKKLAHSHIDRIGENTDASTFTAVGSKQDVHIEIEDVHALVEDSGNHNEFYIQCDGVPKDNMVNPGQSMQGMAENCPMFILENATHYGFKWRENQHIVDTLQHTARKLNRIDWQHLMHMTRELYDFRGGETKIKTSALHEFLSNSIQTEKLSNHLGIPSSLVNEYIQWRQKLNENITSEQFKGPQLHQYIKKKRQQNPDYVPKLQLLYHPHTETFVSPFLAQQENNNSELKDKIIILEQILQFLDVCGNYAHYNEETDTVITRKFEKSQRKLQLNKRNRKVD